MPALQQNGLRVQANIIYIFKIVLERIVLEKI